MPVVLRYLVTFALIGLALVAASAMRLAPEFRPSALYIWFVPVILVVAVLFDRGTSLVATIGSVTAGLIWLAPPIGTLGRSHVGDLVALILLTIVGMGIAAIVERLRHAVDDLSRANAALTHASVEATQQMRLFDAVLEGTTDSVYVKDAGQRFVHVNTAAAQVFGLRPDELRGRRDRDFIPPALATVIEATDRALLVTGEPVSKEERVATPDGRVLTFLSHKYPWIGADGRPIGLIGISRDISERKVAENTLKEADAQKQVLLYDINHRIKNHLQSIVGLMSVASARARDLTEARAALVAAGRRLSVLGQVYNRLQINDGQSVVDTRSFIEELCADLLTSLVDTRAIRFDVAAADVELESNRAVTLGLVINELVQNALKYAFAEDHAGVVTVRFEIDGDSLVLVVADDGVGISDGSAPLGTGMGQRLISALTQQLGGTLTRGDGPGTRWTLRFPRCAPAAIAM